MTVYHYLLILLPVLLRCFSLSENAEVCDAESCQTISEATYDLDAPTPRQAVFLQVTANSADAASASEESNNSQHHVLSHYHIHRQDSVITLTTTPHPPQDQNWKDKPMPTNMPDAWTPIGVEAGGAIPFDPFETHWYWPWTRPANGNFDLGEEGQIPTHWERFMAFGKTGLFSKQQARSGGTSVWFSGPGWQLIETSEQKSDRITLTQGTKYSLTFFARSTIVGQNIRTMFVNYIGPASNQPRELITTAGLPQKFHYVSAANTWQKFEHSFTSGEVANKVRMNIGAHGASGDLWIDDIFLTRVDGAKEVGSALEEKAYAMPDPLTEKECKACEQALKSSKADRTECESNIQKGQREVGARIAKLKADLAGVESQMKKLQPGTEVLAKSLNKLYAKEADAYKQLHQETAVTTAAAFLQRRAHDLRDLSGPKRSTGNRSGNNFSAPHGNPDDELLVDRWLQCDDNRKAAQLHLDGCRVKAKSVRMWDTQREKMYKDKADVYIMRVSRQADPLSAQIGEASRLGATIARIRQQISAVKDIST